MHRERRRTDVDQDVGAGEAGRWSDDDEKASHTAPLTHLRQYYLPAATGHCGRNVPEKDLTAEADQFPEVRSFLCLRVCMHVCVRFLLCRSFPWARPA